MRMKWVRISGIVIFAIGIVCVFFAGYIMSQVNAGKQKISKGEQAVKKGNSLFSLNPVTKEVGKNFTNPIQQKINEGKETVAHYEHLANMLRGGGIAGIVIGGVLVLVSFAGKRRR